MGMIEKAKNFIEQTQNTVEQAQAVAEVIKQPQKATATSSRDDKDAKRIYEIIDDREERIRKTLNEDDLTDEEVQALIDYIDRLEELREKTKNRVHKRKLERQRFEHEVSKDMADISIRQTEAAAKMKEAEASMVKAKNEKWKALGIFGGNIVGNALQAGVMLHGINTGASVELIQGGNYTSTTGKNQLPKFSDVARNICETRNL